MALNTPVTVTFNRAPLASSITTNTADTICSGSIQLSRTSDNFNSCVRMATVPSSGDSVTWTVAPLSSLDPTTTYLIRVTRAALDSDGVPAAPFTSGGFTTNQAIVVTGVTPAPATTGVPLNTQISVTFNRAPASITAARADCSGAVALSFDANLPRAGQPDVTLTADLRHGVYGGRDLTGLPLEAAFAVRGGCSEKTALAGLTIVPARILGMDSSIGSIEAGKDADLLIHNGPPLDYRTYVETAFVKGKVYYERNKDRVYPTFERRDVEMLAGNFVGTEEWLRIAMEKAGDLQEWWGLGFVLQASLAGGNSTMIRSSPWPSRACSTAYSCAA